MVDKVAAQVKAMMDGPLTINQKVNQVVDLLEAHGLAHSGPQTITDSMPP